MHRKTRIWVIVTYLAIFFAAIAPKPAAAQAGTAMDLINGVNALRESKGLAPYTVDSYLMGFAQSHSDYMASIGRWTHTRADGTSAFQYGIKENVATGNDMSVHRTIYTIWADWVHWQTMVGYTGGKVGAGVAISGGTVYYTLNVLPEGSVVRQPAATQPNTTAAIPVSQEQPTLRPPLMTSTPETDGRVIHIVQSGETLWTISQAYEVPIDEILRNSGMSPTRTDVYVGDELVIQPATESTPVEIALEPDTPEPGTPTPTPTPTQPRPTLTPLPTRTPAPTATPTRPPSVIHRTLGDATRVGLGLILASGLGLILVVYLGFWKKS